MDELFLHFGPGGHALVESHFLSDRHPKTDFWNQPAIHESAQCFEMLLKSVDEKVNSLFSQTQRPIQLWGHSFGCDLALAAFSRSPDKISFVRLDSPIFDLPLGFWRLAKRLLQDPGYPDGSKDQLAQCLQEFEAKPGVANMWKIIECVVVDSDFARLYWANKTAYQVYLKVQSAMPPLDFLMWKNILNDFLINKKNLRLNTLDSSRLLFRFGKKDPYLDLVADQELIHAKYPGCKIEIIENAGHFTHLEALI